MDIDPESPREESPEPMQMGEGARKRPVDDSIQNHSEAKRRREIQPEDLYKITKVKEIEVKKFRTKRIDFEIKF